MPNYNINNQNFDIGIYRESSGVAATYSGYGWTVSEIEHGPLRRKDSCVSLPFANDVIDFSEYAEGPYFEPREITYKFFKKCKSTQSMSMLEVMIDDTNTFKDILGENTAGSNNRGFIDRIYDPTIDYASGYSAPYWTKARCLGVEHVYHPLSGIVEVSVTYRVYPIPSAT